MNCSSSSSTVSSIMSKVTSLDARWRCWLLMVVSAKSAATNIMADAEGLPKSVDAVAPFSATVTLTSTEKSGRGSWSTVVVRNTVTVALPPSSLTETVGCSTDRVTGVWACSGVPVIVSDRVPLPPELTARTCTSYSVPLVRPVMVYRRSPLIQALPTTVHSSSVLSVALVSMWRTS